MAHNGTAAHLLLAPEFPDVKQLPAILDAEPGDTRFGPARLTVVSGASGAYFGDIKRVFGVPKEIVLVANPRQIPAIQRKLVEEHIKQMEQMEQAFDDVRQVEEHIEASIDKLRTSGDVRVKAADFDKRDWQHYDKRDFEPENSSSSAAAAEWTQVPLQ